MSRLRQFRASLIISALWLLLALLFALQMSLSGAQSWRQALPIALAEWAPWIVLSPLIFWLAAKFPLERPRLLRGLAVNLPVALAAILLAELSFQAMTFGLRRPNAERGGIESGRPPDHDREPPASDESRGQWENGPRGPRLALGGPGPMRHLLHFHLTICLFTVMAAHAYAYFRRYQDRERKAMELAASLAEARLMALQMQLQPHFLFNALNALSALVHSDPQAADDMIANLSELLRRALSAGNHREVPLAQELEYLECYLGIERVRFGDRLVVEWRIETNTRAALVPVLVLQPIVENAIRHGIERRRADVGHVAVASEVLAGTLRVTVTDNGPGLPPESSAPRGHGIGMSNTRARLASLYGEAAQIRLRNHGPDGGCVATLELPLRRADSLHENQSPDH